MPVLGELVKAAEKKCDANTRVALSEVSISFIPLTEIVFDLGELRPAPAPPAKQRGRKGAPAPALPPPPAPDAGLYRWAYLRLREAPPQRLALPQLDRVTAALLSAALAAVLLLLILQVTLR